MSEDQMPVRRRGRPAKSFAADTEEVRTAESAEAHIAIEQQRDYLQHKGDRKEEWYVFQNNKLLKKARYANGNVYCVYVDSLKPQATDPKRKARNEVLKSKLKKLQADGLLRAM